MKSWFNMLAKDGNAKIEIFDEIGLYGIGFKVFSAMLDDLGDVKNIYLDIFSPGGDVLDGMAIMDRLNAHPATIDGHVSGYAGSISSVLLMAADKITMPENAWLFIHNPWMYLWGIAGDANELRQYAEEAVKNAAVLDKIKLDAIAAYRSHAKDLSDTDVADLMDKASWISAADAKTYGLIDVVSDPFEAKNCITSNKLKIPENVQKAISKVFVPGLAKNFFNKNQLPDSGKGASMNKCPKCGKDVAGEFSFCNHCGASMKIDPVSLAQAHEKEVKEARAQAAEVERARCKGISDRCRALKIDPVFEAELINSNEPLAECCVKITAKLQEAQGSELDPPRAAGRLDVGADDADKFRASVKNAICVGAGLETDPKIVAAVNVSGSPRTYHALVKACLIREGKLSLNKIANLNREEIVNEGQRFFKNAAIGSSDLPNVLADVANKSVTVGQDMAETTFQNWCAEGETTDFKNINMVSMSNFGDMKEIPEGANFEQGKVSDNNETTALKTYGRSTTLSRKAQINDDMSALTELPRLMSICHRQKINRTVYDSLTANTLTGPLVAEGGGAIRLFDNSTHVNVYDPSNVPSLTSLAVARKMFRAIKNMKPSDDETAYPGGRSPRYIISGPANETAIENIVNNLPNLQVSGTNTVNPYVVGGRTPLIPVIDDYLGSLVAAASKTYAWYLAGNQHQIPSYKIFYLNGNRVPTFRAEQSGVTKALGIAFDTFWDWAVGLQDWRGLLFCDGDAT